jgi:hypothetical protein
MSCIGNGEIPTKLWSEAAEVNVELFEKSKCKSYNNIKMDLTGIG